MLGPASHAGAPTASNQFVTRLVTNSRIPKETGRITAGARSSGGRRSRLIVNAITTGRERRHDWS